LTPVVGAWFESDGQAEAAGQWYRSSAEKQFPPAQLRLLDLAPEHANTA